MPTYEYECEACGNSWEAEQRITADALKDCPKCGQPKARRLISGSRFLLKGGGWYADGYGSSSKSSGGEAKSETKTETKSEAKTETKSESKPSSSSSD
ncbi:MAG TPA: zinc ribbon domain-containing protein [Polyangiales bacterium]|nr:zinc ribbon domain-containing protein [Polyangiales bacterium]